MSELDRQLLDLGGALEWPATPDLIAAVAGSLETERGPGRARRRFLIDLRPRRRSLALAGALLLLVAGAAVAVPPVRHAIEQVLGLRGATVERVRRLPPLTKGLPGAPSPGRRIAVTEARHAASFRALLPAGGVSAAYVAEDVPGGRITLIIGARVVTEFRGQSYPYLLKLIGPGTRARHVQVGRGHGIYLDRAPHEVFFLDARGEGRTLAARLAGSVLLWQHGPLILRIEGARSLADALALARTLS